MYNGEPLYVIRLIGTDQLKRGTYSHAVPKLYKLGDAKRVCGKYNKRVRRTYNIEKRTIETFPAEDAYEIIPVTLTLGDPLLL